MKKYILIFFVTFCAAPFAYAQDTINPTTGFQSFFGRESTEWNGIMLVYDIPGTGGLLRTGIDTVIDGTQYKKVEYSSAYRGYDELRDSDYDIYLREDTSTGKLWCRFPSVYYDEIIPFYGEGLPREALIADMTLSIGDTFAVFEPDWLDFSIYTVVDTMTIDHRRIIVLRPFWGGTSEQIKFIEGVGCTNLFLYIMYPLGYDNYITCCHKDGELVYHWKSRDDDSDCAPPLWGAGIENREDPSRISVYPNPCTDWINVDGEQIQSVQLFDIKGTPVKAQKGEQNQLNMASVPSGIYYLKIVANNQIAYRTIIKH